MSKDSSAILIKNAEADCHSVFSNIEQVELENTHRVLCAFQRERVSDRHFAPTYGYGYDDIGRITLDKLFAAALFCQDAIVRPQIASGTHALYLCLNSLLGPNEKIIFATGEPYDTLATAINHKSSFKRIGVESIKINLDEQGKIDVDNVIASITSDVRIVYVQRSRGYLWRNSILPGDMELLFSKVHALNPDIITVVDNCYGEFTQTNEPSCFGADILVGSLIKNPGGGFAPTGGYIAGRHDLIEEISNHLTAPGIAREVGSYAGSYLPFYQGLFMAPHTTAQALKVAVLFARIFELCGMQTMPKFDSVRSDIVQTLRFLTREALIEFCVTIQACSPIDSYVTPEPWDMPGYSSKVIMAAGTFIQGSSIELTADAPIIPPYTAYIQGGLTYAHGKIAAKKVLDKLKELSLID